MNFLQRRKAARDAKREARLNRSTKTVILKGKIATLDDEQIAVIKALATFSRDTLFPLKRWTETEIQDAALQFLDSGHFCLKVRSDGSSMIDVSPEGHLLADALRTGQDV